MEKQSKLPFTMGLLIILTLATFSINLIHNKTKSHFTVGIAPWGSYDENLEGFMNAMATSGFIEGENINYLIESSNTDPNKQKEIIQSFIDKKVDLIYSLTTTGTTIAKEMTNEIPIVFSIVTHPVEANLISSLKNSKNNLVGTRNYISPAKQFYTFEQIIPNAKKIAFIRRTNETNSNIQFKEFSEILSSRDIELLHFNVEDNSELEEKLINNINEIDAIYLACDTLIQAGGEEIAIKIAIENNIPTFSCNEAGVRKGSLVGAVSDLYELGQISGEKAATILNGANPTWIQTESTKNAKILINTFTAETLGIEIDETLLENATELISE